MIDGLELKHAVHAFAVGVLTGVIATLVDVYLIQNIEKSALGVAAPSNA